MNPNNIKPKEEIEKPATELEMILINGGWRKYDNFEATIETLTNLLVQEKIESLQNLWKIIDFNRDSSPTIAIIIKTQIELLKREVK